ASDSCDTTADVSAIGMTQEVCFDLTVTIDGRADTEQTCVTVQVGCTSDDDCTDQVCDTNTGLCVDCLGDGDCDEGETCDMTTNTCTEQGCLGNEDCTGGLVCVGGTCEQCTMDSQCTMDEFCTIDGVCGVPECDTDADCPDGQICELRICVDETMEADVMEELISGDLVGSGCECSTVDQRNEIRS